MKSLFTLMLSLTGYLAYCQTYTIKGTVKSSADNAPLAGATIQINNTKNVTKTDQSGNFTINIDQENGKLKVSYLGYQNKEIDFDINSSLSYNFDLDPQENSLDETVVIAYGQTTKRFNTGSVGRVTAAEISRQPVANPIAALQGRVPGLEITQRSGRTGANFEVLIRGQNSISNGNTPLYLIDGVPWIGQSIGGITAVGGGQSPFNSLNLSDISSIEILKDADATAIYGSRGANGVILITTKKGKSGKTQIDLNAYSGIGRVVNTMKMMTTEEYLSMRREALNNQDVTPTNSNAPDLLLYDQQRYHDWKKILIGNTSKLSDIQVSLSGGNERTLFRMAGGYRRETNVYPGNDANVRGSGQLNLNHRSENDRLKISLTLNYSKDDNSLPSFDLTSGIFSGPNLKVYDDNGNLAWNENGSSNRANPLMQTFNSYSATTNNLISNTSWSYELVRNLFVKINAGYTSTFVDQINVSPLTSFMPSSSRTSGQSTFGKTNFNSWILEPQLHYIKVLKKNQFDFLLGSSWQDETLKGTVINARNYSSDALLFTTSGAANLSTTENYSRYKYQSVFGRINYHYDNRIILNLTGRRDGSSRFGPGKRFANFGAIGVAWIFSEEQFAKSMGKWFSFGKVRGSYGLTGNDKIGDYQFMDNYAGNYYTYDGISGLVSQRLANSEYEWESNHKLEFASELGFFDNRILLSTGWFRNRSGNQLLQYLLPSQTGFASITRNLPALVENRGWEFELNTINIRDNKFSWNSAFNITIAKNKLLNFPNLETSSYSDQYEVGKSLNIMKLYPYLGVDPESGLWTTDLEAGRTIVKNLNNRFYGGLSNSFGFRNFKLDIFLQFVGKDAPSYFYSLPAFPGTTNYNMPVEMLSRWTEKGDITDIQKFGTTGDIGTAITNFRLSEGIITDASFVRLKNVEFSYTLPQKWLGEIKVQNIRIYCQGQNLLTLTSYKGNDPEIADVNVLPPLRVYTIGAQITF